MPFQVPACRFQQNGHDLFLFVCDGKLIPEFTSVPHVGRDVETGELQGFQRPEVKAHIRNIREYIEGGDRPMIPNAVVLAFNQAPEFKPAVKDGSVGTLMIPDGECAVTVDGQQRLAGIRGADVESFPISVVAFVAEDEATLREQFIRVNSSRPLPRQFIMELLPGVNAALTAEMEKKRIPAVVVDRLTNSPDSPLLGLIKTATNPGGEIPGTVFADGIGNSLKSGALSNLRGDDGSCDVDGMVTVMTNYWKAVAATFRHAWELDRKASRITYGGPVGALLGLMDEIAGALPVSKLTQAFFKRELAHVAPHCHWTEDSGDWNFGPDGTRPWDGIENGSKGIGFLRDFLIRTYRRAKTKPDDDENGEAA